MARRDEYRRFSEGCLQLAREVRDEQVRLTLLHMAQVWLRLAEQQEQEILEDTLMPRGPERR